MSKKLWIGTQDDPADRTIITVSDADYKRTFRENRLDPIENAKVYRMRNLTTGKMVKIRHAPCGMICYCAMEFVK
jgi:hypothetical protein